MSAAQIESYLAKIELPCPLDRLPTSAYLVGGSVRDALLQRYKTPVDLDFVLPDKAIATAKNIANRYRGGFVVLDEGREIARVAFSQGTLDFARQEGASLETDLRRRDFTINTIAYNLHSQTACDPLNGLEDLQRGIIRMVSPNNLTDDPLRLLRAYRQAAQLDFTIEGETRTAIQERTALLQKVAAERVQAELNYILTARGHKWLVSAISDGLFDFWLPSAKGVEIEQLEAVAKGIDFCRQSDLNHPELTITAKLATLVAAEPTTAEAELTQLKYARSQIKTVVKTVTYLPKLQQLTSQMSLREQYFWFLDVKDIFPVLMARAIATDVPSAIMKPLVQRYLDPTDLVAHPQCLVTGNDLIRELNLKPSPVIGNLLTEIQIAQIESKIATPQQAISYANFLLPKISDRK